jgi:hypothetical protein
VTWCFVLCHAMPCRAVMCCVQWRRFMEAVGDYNCTLQAGSAQPASNTTGGSTKRGRRLQQHRMHSRRLQGDQQGSSTARALQQAAGAEPHYSCKKLGAGA